MKLVIDVPEEMVKRVRDVVRKGGYEEPRDLVVTALENQLEMEEGEINNHKTLKEAIQELDERSDGSREGRGDDGGEKVINNIGRREYVEVPTISTPDEERLNDPPLWGQHNRIFPVKLTVRVLANYIAEQNGEHGVTERTEMGTTDLGIVQEEAARTAREFGRKVSEYDDRKGRKRGNKLSTALPIGEDKQKSMSRFKNHFVGHTHQDGSLKGATPNMLFVNIFPDGIDTIGLTEAGLEFAELPNPLIDDGPDADRSLSDEEREFYIQHMRENIPGEYEAMGVVARAISEGDDRPDSLTERVAELNPEWGESVARTMRSGLFSRMKELGLVGRETTGQRSVRYMLTDEGEMLLRESEEVNG